MTATNRKFTTALLLFITALGCAPPPPPLEPEPVDSAGAESAEPAHDIVGEELDYESGGVKLKGYLAWDRKQQGPRPGVLVVHEWWGHNEYVRTRARQLAEMGYTALALDMYGEGKNTSHPADAKKFMTEALSNMDAMRARFEAALSVLTAHESTDPQRSAAIGYCFGGAVVLNMARAGVDLDAVASFHGSLGAAKPAAAGSITPKLLVLTGAADPMVPPDAVAAFEQEMRFAGAQLELVSYPGAQHAFTNPAATEAGAAHKLPLKYDAAADADSWKRLDALLKATFAQPEPSAEQKAAAAAAAKNRGDFARMEAESAAEAARLADPEVKAKIAELAKLEPKSTAAALKKLLPSPHRQPGHAERDAHRHPKKTLAFFGVKPTSTVFEQGPGAGWYTELLAPMLAAKGRLIVDSGDAAGSPEKRSTLYAKRFKNLIDRAPELYGKVQVVTVGDPAKPALGLDGTVDVALVIRQAHNWQRSGSTAAWLAEIHRSLKRGGVLGVIDHRAADGETPEQAAKRGRLSQKAFIAEVEAAGFKLQRKSEMNANPKDTRDHASGVWTLPPTLKLGEQDKEKYLAIGESDRMTLKFVKVEKKAPKAAPTEVSQKAGDEPAATSDQAGASKPAKPAAAPSAPAAKPADAPAPAAKPAGGAPTPPAKPTGGAPAPAAAAKPAG
ncbi:MAG: dienelactone hydrolase family protein [Myxococcales bacterium]|nr:dienelactone hydrolase family protein [Myxococcales bacterium]